MAQGGTERHFWHTCGMPPLPNPWVQPTMPPAAVATALSVSIRTVYRLCAAGELPKIGARIPTAFLYSRLGLPCPPSPAAMPKAPVIR